MEMNELLIMKAIITLVNEYNRAVDEWNANHPDIEDHHAKIHVSEN